MKQNLIIIAILLSIVVLPLVTSLLLDWSFIAEQKSRKLVIYFFMVIEVIISVIVLLDYLKDSSN